MPVFAAVDADRMPRPALGVADPAEDVTGLGPHHRRVLMERGQRLNVGDIDRLASPNHGPRVERGQTADHRVSTRLAGRMESRPPNRLPVRSAVQVKVARPGVVREAVRPRRAHPAPDLARPGARTER